MNDSILQAMIQWLKTCPIWEGQLFVDFHDGNPGSVGLYPAGVEEIDRREDVLGNVTARYRCHFELLRITAGQQDNTGAAVWLLQFQEWVRQQSRLGLTPTFGQEPAREQIRAEKGKLKSASQTGTGAYSVHLTAEYVLKG